MSAIDRTLESLTFLTEEAREALRRRLHELGGLALILLRAGVHIALATWSVRDPRSATPPHRQSATFSAPWARLSQTCRCRSSPRCARADTPIALWGWRPDQPSPARARAHQAGGLGPRHRTHRRIRSMPARPTSWPLPVGLAEWWVTPCCARGLADGGSLGSFAYVVIGATTAVLGFNALAITHAGSVCTAPPTISTGRTRSRRRTKRTSRRPSLKARRRKVAPRSRSASWCTASSA